MAKYKYFYIDISTKNAKIKHNFYRINLRRAINTIFDKYLPKIPKLLDNVENISIKIYND